MSDDHRSQLPERLRYLHAQLSVDYSTSLAKYALTAHPNEDVSKAGTLLYGPSVDEYRTLLAEAASARGIATPLRRRLWRSSKGVEVAELRRVANLVGLPSWPVPDST